MAESPFSHSVSITNATTPSGTGDSHTVYVSEAIGRDSVIAYFPSIGNIVLRDGHGSQASVNVFDSSWMSVIDAEWTASTGALFYNPRYKGSSISGFDGLKPTVLYY